MEAEEAQQDIKGLRISGAVAGVLLLIPAAYIGWMIYLTQALLVYYLPLVALALFLVMGCSALYAGLAVPSSVKDLWSKGKFSDSGKKVRGALPIACIGGILPGFFAFRAARTMAPMIEKPVIPQVQPTYYCPACSAPLKYGDRFCSVCGKTVSS